MGIDLKGDQQRMCTFAGPGRLSRKTSWTLGLLCVLLVSCSGFFGGAGSQQVLPQTYGADALAQQGLKKALQLIQEGKRKEARTVLETLLQEEEPARMNPSMVLYLGAMQLLEREEPARLEASKEYLQACTERFPAGPYRDNAEQIVRLLEGRIKKARREGIRNREMGRLVEKQKEEIQSLKYKIQKLEEIQKETDLKRESLDLK